MTNNVIFLKLFFLPFFLVAVASSKCLAQGSYVDISITFLANCGPGGMGDVVNAQFNGTNISSTHQLTFSSELVSYSFSGQKRNVQNGNVCGSISGNGIVPNPYKSTLNFEGTRARVSFTYCNEPVLPAIQVMGDGTGSDINLSLPVWGFRYQWEVASGSGGFQPLKTIGDGVTPMTSSAITVATSELASIFGSAYGQNFFFRAIVTGCKTRTTTITSGVTFSIPPPTVSIVGTPSPANCYQSRTGAVTLDIGSSYVDRFYINCRNLNTNYAFSVPTVSRGVTTITGLDGGKWELTVVNNATQGGLGNANKIAYVDIIEPSQVRASFSAPPYQGYYIRCNGGVGSVTAIGSGGNGDYQYEWSTTPITTDAMLANRTTGIYSVTIKDKKGCTSIPTSVTLNEPPLLEVSLSKGSDHGGYPVSCFDKADGAINSTVNGGVAGYSYHWSNEATGSVLSNVGVGSYSVTVNDANGCTATSDVLSLNAPLPIDFTIDQLSGLSCAGDRTAMLEAQPVLPTIIGTPTYLWSSGERTAGVSDKGAGTYTITISDSQGCSTSKSVIIDDPAAHSVSIIAPSDYNGQDIKCYGESNGKLAAIVKDANGIEATAENYEWLKDNGIPIGSGPSLSSLDLLSRGTYKVIITYGAAQCKSETSFVLNEPDAVSVSVLSTTNYNGQAISCSGSSDANVRAMVTGGTGVYSYSWSTGEDTQLLTRMKAGHYTVNVTDVNGCTGNGSITLVDPQPIEVLLTDFSDYTGYGVSCAGVSDGFIKVEGSGGTGVYSYSWSNGATTQQIGGLSSGDYTITVSDNNGCKQELKHTIRTPALLGMGVSEDKNISCFNGSDGLIVLQASGGAGGYEYSRDNGASWQLSTSRFENLQAGSYALKVRDGNGCSTETSHILTQPPLITILFKDVMPAFCEDPRGEATAEVGGGVGDYTYKWHSGTGDLVGENMQMLGVYGGLYTLTVKDGNGCEMNDEVAITSTDGAKTTYSAESTRCFDSSDGRALITTTEGDGPFTITWPDGQGGNQGINLSGGVHNVLIKDGHECTVVEQVVVPSPASLSMMITSKVVPTCNGVCDGSLTLEALGGVGGYTYLWNNSTLPTQNQLCSAKYSVEIKDANGCQLLEEVELEEPSPIEIEVLKETLSTCKDGCDGKLEVIARGGNGGYAYIWEGGERSPIKENICPGNYIVSVVDQKGCLGEGEVKLSNTPALPLDLGGGVTLCVGQTYKLNAGEGWDRIHWGSNTGYTSTAQELEVRDAGAYWLEVLSDKGCIGRDTFLLATSFDLLQASFMIPKEAFVGDTVAMIDISWPLPETIEWNFPVEMNKLLDNGEVVYGRFASVGSYEVGMTARLGECVDYVSKEINVIGSEVEEEAGRLGYEEYVKAFTLYPNPNNGSFKVRIELTEDIPIAVSVWHFPSGFLMTEVQKNEDNFFDLDFNLRSLSAGIYVLRLDYDKGKKYIRFVVN
ncbi:T9SS type A sorting domain-containing protein [Chryseosolibacter indicus]|uniref:T9SS type A sorting domain-containing protein n=1 Tax=Chryseosolibacter indicus TaxID=2782351 RepID=A0ABS5VW14_9BACT|nr:T9SS type A sorting domain-containing protein [Chryseosolibacter indicus]MBT1705416.1 T9SS type A sorting domain-containing protein [Chryseosolibacter indicus]